MRACGACGACVVRAWCVCVMCLYVHACGLYVVCVAFVRGVPGVHGARGGDSSLADCVCLRSIVRLPLCGSGLRNGFDEAELTPVVGRCSASFALVLRNISFCSACVIMMPINRLGTLRGVGWSGIGQGGVG